jgi:lysyl-tRNA synthetase class 1
LSVSKAQRGLNEVLFETGYGPSGLPHIGTFGEVARTTMVRTAFRLLTRDEVPTRLLCFSDDMDGMRKIPDNVPDQGFLEPLSADAADVGAGPLRTAMSYESFGAPQQRHAAPLPRHLRLQLRVRQRHRLLQVGQVRRVLLRAAERYDDIMA